jgi:hypothetical protein
MLFRADSALVEHVVPATVSRPHATSDVNGGDLNAELSPDNSA